MLTELRVSNLALLREAVLEPGTGFLVLTGETGAGKSVLLGALSILAGSRVDKSVIGRISDQAEVEAVLRLKDSGEVDAVLASAGLPTCEEGELILRRSVGRKQSRVSVNGKLATVAVLQEIGESWIDFHGPGEPQKLFREAFQLGCLDRYAGLEADLSVYREEFDGWTRLIGERDRLREADELSPDEAVFLREQISRIEDLDPTEERIEELEARHRRISSGREIAALAAGLSEALAGEEGIGPILMRAVQMARQLEGLEPTTAGLRGRLDGVVVELDDLAGSYADFAGEMDLDPETIAVTEAEMAQWLELRRKYGGSCETVRTHLERMRDRLESQSDIAGRLRELDAEIEDGRKRLAAAADQITAQRRKAAKALEKAVTGVLGRLGFRKALFQIEIIAEAELRRHGDSRCSFRFAPNPGEPPAALNKIASSGETARVMLALKSILAEVDRTPVLVFDEVDANVGGEIGAEVGKEMGRLGEARQVLCVTHLPQVAALGSEHYLVTKTVGEMETHVTISRIDTDPSAREDELARMLGNRRSASAREHARALLGAEEGKG